MNKGCDLLGFAISQGIASDTLSNLKLISGFAIIACAWQNGFSIV